MISIRLESLKESKPTEFVMRFVFGGCCTAFAGLIARKYGPGVGGLFLAFPAIFPAGASLIETHEKQRKSKLGRDGTTRGRLAAALDAAGATLGAIGLAAFAAVACWGISNYPAVWAIAASTVVWLLVSAGLWLLRRHGVLSCPIKLSRKHRS